MTLRATSLKTPGTLVSNDALLELIRDANGDLPPDEVETYCRRVASLLAKSGAHCRRLRDRAGGETALSFMIAAVREALDKASLRPADLGLLIFCGVGRGFVEPSNAAFLCQALDLACDFFDVSDACMSWVRALQIADSLLSTGVHEHIMIVNGEFTAFEFGLPGVLKVRSREELNYTFPALTIGEAATATVVSRSPARWRFRFRTDAQKADLCTVPLPGYRDFCLSPGRIGLNGPLQLVSFGADLTSGALEALLAFVGDTFTEDEIAAFDLWFPHAASASLCDTAAKRLGLGGKLYSAVFPKYGNLISASVPAAVSTALDEGVLQRGSRIVFCPASAGLSLALVDGVF